MIPSGVEIFLGLAPIDLRWGFDRLAGLVDEQIGRAARSGALFVFFGKRRSALKILFFDGGGLCLFYSGSIAARFVCHLRCRVTPRASSSVSVSWMTCWTASTSTSILSRLMDVGRACIEESTRAATKLLGHSVRLCMCPLRGRPRATYRYRNAASFDGRACGAA